MTHQNKLTNFIKYVSVNILGALGFSLYVIIDTYFIAQKLGSSGLAALNFCIPVITIIQAVGLLLGLGGATLFTIQSSGGDSSNKNQIFTTSLTCSILISVVCIFLGIFFTQPLSILLGASGETIAMTQTYLKTLLLASPLFILSPMFQSFLRNDNNPTLATSSMVTCSVLNIILDYIFMYHFHWGIFGAIFATVLSMQISFLLLLSHFFTKKSTLKLSTKIYNHTTLKQLLPLGFSAFLGEIASAIVLIVFNLVIAGLAGNLGVAAYGIIANVSIVSKSIFTGATLGIQPLASFSYGSDDSSGVKTILNYSMVFTLATAVLQYILVLVFADPIIHLFNKDGDILLAEIAKTGITIYFIGYIFAGFNITTSAFLSAINSPKAAFVISILRSTVIIIPLVYIFSYLWNMNGVWLSFVVTELIVLAFSIYYIIKSPKTNQN